MALQGEAKKLYQRDLMRKRREEEKLAKAAEWDKEKYPDRVAFEEAFVRVVRAREYAAKFPDFIHTDDLKFQDLDWQYRNEGLPFSKKREIGVR